MDVDDAVIVFMGYVIGEHDVDPVLQRLSFREGEKGVLSHGDGMSLGCLAEELHILLQMEHEFVLSSDAPFAVGMQYGDEFHIRWLLESSCPGFHIRNRQARSLLF